jgi:formamidopyrimidine-DNA glycosylase
VQAGPRALRRRWSQEWEASLLGRRIQDVTRRGKWIVIGLGDGDHLVIHLGMTGQLTIVPAGTPLADHTHLVFRLSGDHEQLRFRDIRRFGSAELVADDPDLQRFFANKQLGPEPFHLKTTPWRQSLRTTRRCLKAVLLDQRVVAGIGNIYADEALFQARLHPTRLGCELSTAESARLSRALGIVLNRAIDKRGSSIRNYIGGSGLKGEYQNEFRVYGRAGQPCMRCRSRIERIRLAGRSPLNEGDSCPTVPLSACWARTAWNASAGSCSALASCC